MIALALGVVWPDVAGAFDARGRKRRGRPADTSARDKPRPRTGAGATKQDAGGQGAPDTVTREEALLERYIEVALKQPGATFPLKRLADLARARDGNLDGIIQRFIAMLEQPAADPHATQMALAGLYVQDNQLDLAKRTYQAALTVKRAPLALAALAALENRLGDPHAAIALLEEAVALTSSKLELEERLRDLMGLQLDVHDLTAARATHARLVKAAGGAYFVRAELAQEFMRRQEYPAAEEEYRALVRALAGDSRAEAPALIDLSRALLKNAKPDEAISVLRRAERKVSAGSGLHREVLALLVEAHRAAARLPELLTLLAEHPRDFESLRLLAILHEELGNLAEATATARQALRTRAGDLELRARLIRLLEVQGQLTEALSEHRELIRRSPGNVEFVLRYVESLLRQGQKREAKAALLELERRPGTSNETLAALVEIYERLGDGAHALALLERLAATGGGDPDNIVELGRRQFRDGKTEQALATWRRLLNVSDARDRPAAHARLAELLLEHDFIPEAKAEIGKAITLAPTEVRYRSALARVLERFATLVQGDEQQVRYRKALEVWHEVLRSPALSPAQRREALTHVVTLWGFDGDMQPRLVALTRRFSADPADVISGLLLAELYIRQKDLVRATQVLERVVALRPGDLASLERLEYVLSRQARFEEALAVLAKLVRLDPARARLHYQRMARLAAQLYQDDRALSYAAKAVELSPEDAAGHLGLGEMYRRRQKWDEAIAEFRLAVEKDEYLFPAYFQLAELLLQKQQPEEADKWLRGVVRLATDEELILRAGRQSLELNLARGDLGPLERELLPLSLARTDRSAYRRLLVELYGVLSAPWLRALEARDPQVRGEATEALQQLAQRATRPLLDALTDAQHGQQAEALRLLTRFRSPGAIDALLAFAASDAQPELRTLALFAVGSAREVRALERLVAVITSGGHVEVDEGDAVRLAATWALVQLDSPKARQVAATLLESASPTAVVLATLGLALHTADTQRAHLLEHLQNGDLTPVVRAAAAFYFAQHPGPDATPALRGDAVSRHPMLRAMSLRALESVDKGAALSELSLGLFDPDARVRRAALTALADDGTESKADLQEAIFSQPAAARLAPDALIEAALGRPPTPARGLRALSEHARPIGQALAGVLGREPERASELASLLMPDAPERFYSFVTGGAALEAEVAAEALSVQRAVAEETTSAFVAALDSPSVATRAAIAALLTTRPEAAARRAVDAALAGDEALVRRAIVRALYLAPSEATIELLVQALSSDDSWALRVDAARALQSAGREFVARRRDVYVALLTRAQSDRFALVREACVRALFAVDGERATQDAQVLIEGETERHVRQLIAELADER